MRVAFTLLLGAIMALASSAVSAQEAGGEYSAFGTGTVIHAEAIEQPELSDPESVRVVDADVAFSGATVDSTGLPPTVITADGAEQRRHNEWGGTVQPEATVEDEEPVDGLNAYGRGYGLDVSLGQEGQEQGQLTRAGLAEAVAPPPSSDTQEIGPVPGDPLAYASLLRGAAEATWTNELGGCASLGTNLSAGRGEADRVELLDQAGPDEEGAETDQLEQPVISTTPGDRTTSTSFSHNFLAAQTDADGNVIGDNLAVVSETRQTIAPVTFFAGTENQFTIEFLGEWVLRAVATGIDGEARIHYGPADTSPTTRLITIIHPDGTEEILTTQDLFGDEGLVIDALPLANIVIGEDPRAIEGAPDSEPIVAADGTSASAAVDVVRVQFLSEAGMGEVAEIRIGHMEVSAIAPEGGVNCDDVIPVTKDVEPETVFPGDAFSYTITIDNPFACTLTNVRVEDTISSDSGVEYTVTGTDPEADSVSDTRVVWNNVGPIEPGGSVTLTIDAAADDDSAAGLIVDEVDVDADCEGGPIAGQTEVETTVPLTGTTRLEGPTVEGTAAAPDVGAGDREMPATGPPVALTLGGLLVLAAGGALGLRGRNRQRP